MTAYRDDLQAAQERIHALEEEVARLRNQGHGADNDPKKDLVLIEPPASRKTVPSYVWFALPVIIIIAGERIPASFPLGVALFILMPIVLYARERNRLQADTDELLLLTEGKKLSGWVGPSDKVRIRRKEQVYRFALRPRLVTIQLPAVALQDGSIVDLKVELTVELDMTEYQSSGETETVNRALSLLGFPPDFEALSGPVRDSVDAPLRKAASTWSREKIETSPNLLDQPDSPEIDSIKDGLDSLRSRFGLRITNTTVTLARIDQRDT